ncbi:LicD family protein [Butyrivibrio sp. YAB3001]|uniref:LicD family protein n=1 Tax=Butyrivibrio sp. YAB3001 TaxID=1520812 RepID=UPI0008F62BA8|nr:LicD family protein [Butyrivibrio sp. YAB3001]SFC59556.1 lipopolysaccharide cholinephosphotransferase [Butyrivibrio sp. YAB3001]
MPILNFPEDYFTNEIRCDFYITAMMKRLWASQMEILAWIDAKCNEHDIRYIVFNGSMLGAIRHKGFIPWDDDIDIAMLREDYVKFTKVLEKELPPYLKTKSLMPGAIQPKEMIFNIGNGGKLDTSPEFLERFHGCPYATGIDIFVHDKMTKDPQEFAYQDRLIRMLDRLLTLRWKVDDSTIMGDELNEYGKLKRVIEQELGYTFTDNEAVSLQILRLIDAASSLCDDCDSDRVAVMQDMLYTGDRGMCERHFTDRIYVPFENVMSIPVPKDYDEVLRNFFGDYNVFVMGAAGHNYPIYQFQRIDLYKAYKQRGWKIPEEFLEYDENGRLVLDPATV